VSAAPIISRSPAFANNFVPDWVASFNSDRLMNIAVIIVNITTITKTRAIEPAKRHRVERSKLLTSMPFGSIFEKSAQLPLQSGKMSYKKSRKDDKTATAATAPATIAPIIADKAPKRALLNMPWSL
jgi:hypothetical protein